MSPLRFASAFATILALSLHGMARDWPQFRGPDSTAVAANAAIPLAPKIDWTVPLPGRGLSSPIVVGGKVFVTCSSGPKQQRLHLICFSATDGRPLWERELLATGRTMSHPKTAVAACTPCSDGKHVVALWSSNDLAAFDLEGNLLWIRGLTVDYPNVSNSLGMASSPIIIGETVVAMVENDSESYSLGIDVRTGRNLWKLDRPKAANWTSPLPWRTEAKALPLALLQSAKGILAVDPVSGSRVWEYTQGASTTSSSVVANGIIYAASHGVTALKPAMNGKDPEQLWRLKQMNPATISPLVIDGRVVSINGAGVIATADAATGKAGWKLRLISPFSGSPVGAGKHVVAVNEKGLLQIVELGASEGKVVGQLQLPLKEESKEMVLCTPALSERHIFVRTDSALWRIGQ